MLETTLTVLLIASVVVGGTGGVLWWRAAHTAEVRRVVVELRELLDTVVANGGLDAPAFLTENARRTEQELEDLVGRVNGRKLRRACSEVLEGYRCVWASAPPQLGPRIYSSSDTTPNPVYAAEDRQRAEQYARQVDDARSTLDAIRRVLDRVNALERFLPRRG